MPALPLVAGDGHATPGDAGLQNRGLFWCGAMWCGTWL